MQPDRISDLWASERRSLGDAAFCPRHTAAVCCSSSSLFDSGCSRSLSPWQAMEDGTGRVYGPCCNTMLPLVLLALLLPPCFISLGLVCDIRPVCWYDYHFRRGNRCRNFRTAVYFVHGQYRFPCTFSSHCAERIGRAAWVWLVLQEES